MTLKIKNSIKKENAAVIYLFVRMYSRKIKAESAVIHSFESTVIGGKKHGKISIQQ